MPSEEDPLNAHPHSIHHRAEIERSETCGCFSCLAIFAPPAITKWAEEEGADNATTALCPRCGTDAVLGSESGYPITRVFLAKMRRHWF